MILKHSNLYRVLIFLILGGIAFLYVFVFYDLLNNGETVGYGFQAIVQSDTMLFREIFQSSNIALYLDANVKNTIVPVYMWTFISGNWYLAVFVNVLFLSAEFIYLRKIAEQIEAKITLKTLFWFLILLPETFVYLIGILKEIPTLFFFTTTTYYFLNRKWGYFFLFFLFLILFRYQFAFSLALFFSGNIIFGKNNIRFLFFIFFILSASYPFLINNLQILGREDAMLYREMSGGLGIGEIIEKLQSSIYGFSFIATIIKFFQMMVEPWPALNLYDNNGINILAIAYSISAVIWLSIWYKYFRIIFNVIKNPRLITQNQNTVMCISFSFLIMVALNSFVHHRYLYPGMGLILIFAHIPINRKISNSN